jgi:hypothetical protein
VDFKPGHAGGNNFIEKNMIFFSIMVKNNNITNIDNSINKYKKKKTMKISNILFIYLINVSINKWKKYSIQLLLNKA